VVLNLHARIIIKLRVDQAILIKIPAWCCERDVVLCKFPFAPTAGGSEFAPKPDFRPVTLFGNCSQALAAVFHEIIRKMSIIIFIIMALIIYRLTLQ